MWKEVKTVGLIQSLYVIYIANNKDIPVCISGGFEPPAVYYVFTSITTL